MANSEKRCIHAATATMSKKTDPAEQEEAMLRNEFKIMQKLDFAFIREIGARNAEEYIIKITRLEFLEEKDSRKED